MQTSIKLGEEIKKIRTTLNIDQKDFAKVIGISNVHLSNVEKGKKLPSEDLLTKIYQLIHQDVPEEIIDMLKGAKSDNKNKSQNVSNNIVYNLQEEGIYNYSILKDLLKNDPGNVELVLGMLTLLREEGKVEEARQHLLQSLIHIKKEEIKRWLEASYFLLEGNYSTAIELMKKAISEFEKHSENIENKEKYSGLIFELANMYYEYGYSSYNLSLNLNLAIECFTNSLKYFNQQRSIYKNPYYEMIYANVFWWLAFLGIDAEKNWLLYIDKAENVLLINHEQTMIKSIPGKPAKPMYSEHYLMQIISGMAEAYAQLAKIEYKKDNLSHDRINYYLKKGELLLVQHAPLHILPERTEYYNFYFSYSCFYSIKAEMNSYIEQEYDNYLDLCEKGLQEVVFGDYKNKQGQALRDINDAKNKELRFYVSKRKNDFEYIEQKVKTNG